MQHLAVILCIESTIDYSPFSADGYKCASSCYDLPQDEPKKEDRKSNIEFYKLINNLVMLVGNLC